jgi:hypothetical protein
MKLSAWFVSVGAGYESLWGMLVKPGIALRDAKISANLGTFGERLAAANSKWDVQITQQGSCVLQLGSKPSVSRQVHQLYIKCLYAISFSSCIPYKRSSCPIKISFKVGIIHCKNAGFLCKSTSYFNSQTSLEVCTTLAQGAQ